MTVARRILLHVALGAVFVVAVVTAVTYRLVYDAVTQRDLRHLKTYVDERALREEARFQQVQSNMLLVRGQYLKRLDLPMSPEYLEERWNYWYEHSPDGAWRTRKQFSDARISSSLWADKEWPATPELRRQALIAQELCDEMLPGWVDSFPSYYFQFPAPGHLNVGVDTLLPNWSWEMPAHFDVTGLEWMELAAPQGVPPERFSWTGLQQDSVVTEPLVSVYLPVIKDGVFIASVGHNMPMRGRLDEATHSNIKGVSHFLFRTDGRLIAHPTKRQEILDGKGLLTAQDCGDKGLASLYRIAASRSERRYSDFDPGSDSYFSFARLAGPEWYYVTVMPRSFLQKQASASAQWVLWSGLISLGLVLGVTAAILRGQVARPLAELTRATKGMGTPKDPVSLPQDEIAALAGSFSEMAGEVAERQRVQVELERALERERELVKLKSNFVSLVSHEFRTPLGIILSSTEILGLYFATLSPAERAEQLDAIKDNVLRMSALMEEVLLFSRLEAGGLAFTPEPIELAAFCARICDEVLSATRTRCPIEWVSSSDLDGARGDEGLLRHILSNLLSNAVKYSKPGTLVRGSANRQGNNAVFTIADHGIGIPAEAQGKVFQAFYRAENADAFAGTGLGLVVVKRCVDLHGGTISIQSVEGAGTTASVSLPLFAEPSPRVPPTDDTPSP